MKTLTKSLSLLTVASLALMGCPGGDDSPPVDDNNGTTTDNPQTDDNPTGPPETEDGTTIGGSATGDTTEGDSTSTGEPEPELPTFDPVDPAAYTPVDRMGFPAVNTGLNLLGDKDAYNAATPDDDASLTFISNILDSLDTLHIGPPGGEVPDNTGLDDDLTALTITPCVTPGLPMDTCDDQGAPFVIPDVLGVEVGGLDSFPNGRRPPEPVMDIVFAVILVDLSTGPNAILTFLDLDGDGTPGPSLNPLENDVPFSDTFPYLAPAHEM